MEGYIAKKRVSMYLVLLCWAFAVAGMHPGLAMIFWAIFMLLALIILRFICHIEGECAPKNTKKPYKQRV